MDGRGKVEMMRAACLTLTEGIQSVEGERLAVTLRSYLPVDGPSVLRRRSVEGLAQYVQLLASWETWTAAFGIFAAALLAKLGHCTAEVLWDTIRDCLKRDDAKPLADVSKALSNAGRASSAQIFIGLDFPESHCDATLVISESAPEQIAYSLARFVNMAEKIFLLVSKEIDAGHCPLARAFILFSEDGSVQLRWMTQDLKERKLQIPED
jgi:hypothetical protein